MRKIILLIFFISSCFWLYSCEDKLEPPKTNLSSDEIPDQESWNSTVVFSDSGNIKAILKAKHISVFNAKNVTLIDSGAEVDFYKSGIVVSNLKGKRASVLEPSKNIEIYDSVVVNNKTGSTLKTQKLFWDNKKQKVSSDVFVSIVTPREKIEGIGFESDQSLSDYKIFKVTGTFAK